MALRRSRSGSPQRTSLGIGSETALGPPCSASRESAAVVVVLSSRAATLPASTRLDEVARNCRRDGPFLVFMCNLLWQGIINRLEWRCNKLWFFEATNRSEGPSDPTHRRISTVGWSSSDGFGGGGETVPFPFCRH